MVKFAAKEREEGEACFVYEESLGVILELKPPADLEAAKAFAAYLNDNVRGVKYDTTRE